MRHINIKTDRMKCFRVVLVVTVLSLCNLRIYSQSTYYTTTWKEIICMDGNFKMRVPSCYTLINNCGSLYKLINQKKKFPLDEFSEIFHQGHDYMLKKDPETYLEWIEYRARTMYSADGPDGSMYSDSVAVNITFKNKNGITGNKVYIYLTDFIHENGIKIKTTSIQGPVYVFKLHHDLNAVEPAIFFRLGIDQDDFSDRRLIEMMMDTFEFLTK